MRGWFFTVFIWLWMAGWDLMGVGWEMTDDI